MLEELDETGVAEQVDPVPKPASIEVEGAQVVIEVDVVPLAASRRSGASRSERRVTSSAVMKIPKPTDADKAKFQALVPDDPRVVIKPMFGNLGAYVNGNMFIGLFGSDIGVKLADADQRQLRDAGGGSFGPEERPMGGYVTLPADLSPRQAGTWIAKSLAHVGAFPAKQPKPARRVAATTNTTRSR